jgi:hypothetical protein
VLSADWQEFERGGALHSGSCWEEKRGVEGSKKYLKKYFAEVEKIATFAAPEEGKRKRPEAQGRGE